MASSSIRIKNGRIIDPSQDLDTQGDVLLVDGKVEQVGRVGGGADTVIDASGLIVCPGLIDIHVHFREPGGEEAETIASGSEAAVAGGFASVACMPNTEPPLDDATAIEFVCRQAARAHLCNVYPIGAITKGRQGKELAEMGQMVRAGAVAFSDDGSCVRDTGVMLRAMQYVSMFDKGLIQHCEDDALANGGVMNGGAVALRLGLPGISPVGEELAVQRDIVLARTAGCRYHVAHVSTGRAVALIRQAKRDGLGVTTEVCPHHLLLTDEACRTYDSRFKVSPPLRAQADVEACLQGVVDGTIDCLVTDHAPHRSEAKEVEFLYAPFGMVGLEASVGLFAKALIESKRIDWPAMLAMMTINPARAIGVAKGTLAVGADADVTLIDPARRWVVDSSTFRSRGRNCPFDGMAVVAKPVMTIVGGAVKYRDEAQFGG